MKSANFEPVRPYFDCNGSGVYYCHIETGKDGGIIEKPPLRLSDTIDIIGRGIDANGGHYRIIRWRDTHTRRTAALACADIGTPQSWQRLQGCGITILSGRRKRELLADYLQTDGATTPYTVADKAGWQGSAYILPSGEIVNQTSEKVIYNGTGGQAYTEAGSLKDWQDNIARYAAGNSRLLLALGTSLAAPLLHILHEAGGGFHICGDSSDGKTTASLVGLSVWGQPQTLKKTWRGTDLGFSNLALERNDGFLVLDEIGEAAPKTVSKTAYSVINGKSKAQGAKDGGNRPDQEWRILLFSTGEYSMQTYMERAGEPWEAGQAVRLPSVPAAARYGIYDTLHGFANGATLSDHLQQAAAQYHGTAARAWLSKLQTIPADITGLAAGIGTAGIKQCFEDWFAANGAGKHEDRQIIRSMAAFMQQHAHGMRFADWHSEYTNRDHAGYRREGDPNEKAEYWIIPAVFEGEILQGKDTKKACTVLHSIGWLSKSSGNRWRFKKFGKGRFYVLLGAEPPCDTED